MRSRRLRFPLLELASPLRTASAAPANCIRCPCELHPLPLRTALLPPGEPARRVSVPPAQPALGSAAGCIAALVSQPFDVVKTRLQTRLAPGRGGLVGTLRGIARAEGVLGLYRGVLPRLLIYAVQGGVFFGRRARARNAAALAWTAAGEGARP